MRYVINLSEESDHLLRQLCDSGRISPTEGISPEEFLSAFVEDQLDELFARRERREAGRKKNAQNAVQSAKERAKAWSELLLPSILLLGPCVNSSQTERRIQRPIMGTSKRAYLDIATASGWLERLVRWFNGATGTGLARGRLSSL